MSKAKANDVVRIELTKDQRAQVKSATGREGEAVELTVQELEERIAPMSIDGRLSTNHNETLLVDW